MGNLFYYERLYVEIYLKNGKKHIKINEPVLRYGAIDGPEPIEVTDWDSYISNMGYKKSYNGIKRLGKICDEIWGNLGEGYYTEVTIYKHKLEKALFNIQHSIVKEPKFTMQELLKTLSANEYVNYLKDNGIKIVSLT